MGLAHRTEDSIRAEFYLPLGKISHDYFCYNFLAIGLKGMRRL